MWPRDWSSDVCSSDLAARWDAARPSTWDSRGRKSDTPFRVNTLLTTHECQEYVDSMLAERRSRSSEEPELACEREGKRMTQDDRKLDERSEEHTSELQSRGHLVCRLLLEKKKT